MTTRKLESLTPQQVKKTETANVNVSDLNTHQQKIKPDTKPVQSTSKTEKPKK